MASRAVSYGRAVLAALNRGTTHRGVATTTAPRMKTYSDFSPIIADFVLEEPPERRAVRGGFVPVYVALGLIALSTSLGLVAAKQQLLYAPNVLVSKKRRETIPEVDDPDWAAEEADRFLNGSLFRRLAHLQDFPGIPDPLYPNSCPHHPGKVEDLRTVGVDPHFH